MEKILISACLLGDKCTYNLKDNYRREVEKLKERFLLVPFCPEVEGGLPTPRKPSEQKGSQVHMEDGANVTRFFEDGAQKALKVCKYHGIRMAILKEKSPSCGTHFIYDGTFTGVIKEGKGVTARLLESYGITCYSEDQIVWLLASIEAKEVAEKEKMAAKRAEKAEKEAILKAQEEEKERILKEREEKAKRPQKEYKKREFKPRFRKEGEEGGEKKPFRKYSHDGENKPFRKDGKRPYSKEGRSSDKGEKRTYKKDGFKSYSKGPRKSYSKGMRTYKKSKPE